MPTISDSEFGDITVRAHHTSSRVALRIAPNGTLRISVPYRTPILAVKGVVSMSRPKIRELFREYQKTSPRYDQDRSIGKSHSLVVLHNERVSSIETQKTNIIVHLSPDDDVNDAAIQRQIREHVIKALRKEAKSYLPRRLAFIAKEHGFSYNSIKLTHASSRWGSCSSSGTISLNISLMQLPFELLDYVLIHELSHTRHMNHSSAFWKEVTAIDPLYKNHRRMLKDHTPNV